jgi:hypothetical protein
MRMLRGIMVLFGWALLVSGCSGSESMQAVSIQERAGYYEVSMD